MKSTMQIAMECDLGYNEVNHIIKSENIMPASISSGKHCFDKYQEDLIHRALYNKGRLTEITYESKMNSDESEPDIHS